MSTFSAKIELTSGDNKLVLDLFKKNFGGSVYTYQPGNPRHRAWSVWRTSDKHARDILTDLQPFLIAKKPQADAVIDFVNICEAQVGADQTHAESALPHPARNAGIAGTLLAECHRAQLHHSSKQHRHESGITEMSRPHGKGHEAIQRHGDCTGAHDLAAEHVISDLIAGPLAPWGKPVSTHHCRVRPPVTS